MCFSSPWFCNIGRAAPGNSGLGGARMVYYRSLSSHEPYYHSTLHQTCTAMFCSTLHCPVRLCIGPHFTELHFTALKHTTLHCTALHCTTLHCTALHCTALHCTALGVSLISTIHFNLYGGDLTPLQLQKGKSLQKTKIFLTCIFGQLDVILLALKKQIKKMTKRNIWETSPQDTWGGWGGGWGHVIFE